MQTGPAPRNEPSKKDTSSRRQQAPRTLSTSYQSRPTFNDPPTHEMPAGDLSEMIKPITERKSVPAPPRSARKTGAASRKAPSLFMQRRRGLASAAPPRPQDKGTKATSVASQMPPSGAELSELCFSKSGDAVAGTGGETLFSLGRAARSHLPAQREQAFQTLAHIFLKARRGLLGEHTPRVLASALLVTQMPNEAELPFAHIFAMAIDPRTPAPPQVRRGAVTAMHALLLGGHEQETFWLCELVRARSATSEAGSTLFPVFPSAFLAHLAEVGAAAAVAHWLRAEPSRELCAVALCLALALSLKPLNDADLGGAVAAALERALGVLAAPDAFNGAPFLQDALLCAATVEYRGCAGYDACASAAARVTDALLEAAGSARGPSGPSAGARGHRLRSLAVCLWIAGHQGHGLSNEAAARASELARRVSGDLLHSASRPGADPTVVNDSSDALIFVCQVLPHLGAAPRAELLRALRELSEHVATSDANLFAQYPLLALAAGPARPSFSAPQLLEAMATPGRATPRLRAAALLSPPLQGADLGRAEGDGATALVEGADVCLIARKAAAATLLPIWAAAAHLHLSSAEAALCAGRIAQLPLTSSARRAALQPIVRSLVAQGNLSAAARVGFPHTAEAAVSFFLRLAQPGCPELVAQVVQAASLRASLSGTALEVWRDGPRAGAEEPVGSFCLLCQLVQPYAAISFLPFALARAQLRADAAHRDALAPAILRHLSAVCKTRVQDVQGERHGAVAYSFIAQLPPAALQLVQDLLDELCGAPLVERAPPPEPFHGARLLAAAQHLIEWAISGTREARQLAQPLLQLLLRPENGAPAARAALWEALADVPAVLERRAPVAVDAAPEVRESVFQALLRRLAARPQCYAYALALEVARAALLDDAFDGAQTMSALLTLRAPTLREIFSGNSAEESELLWGAVRRKCGQKAEADARRKASGTARRAE
eukprot:gnl/Chilomastix_cuspidata/1552.p1 GENE.gnl/Chilomastix_cuspidata/1552~~gnl/Chilomastix_cuspidata/1552.p1  ORF type:complete len:955 (-),score=330.60 gnl/Chilomastix_cuspidata/1552:3431-6295(-)